MIDDGSDGKDGFREHLVFIMELAQPIDQFSSRLLGHCLVRWHIVSQFMTLLLFVPEELHVFEEVFRHHLWIGEL